tara:strand:+ start:698 stop:865 length:168 start_codon:yes stop_codon:yes gene_type:complete
MNKKDYIYLSTICALVLALGIVSYKYKDQSTKQLNKCYQMFELFREATKDDIETN